MINWERIEEAILDAATDGMKATGKQMKARAVQLAPIRKVFRGQRDITKARATKGRWRSVNTGKFVKAATAWQGGEDEEFQMIRRRTAPFSPETRIRRRGALTGAYTAGGSIRRSDSPGRRVEAQGIGMMSFRQLRRLETRTVVEYRGGMHKDISRQVSGSTLAFRGYRGDQPYYKPPTRYQYGLENTAGQVLNTRGAYEMRSGRAFFKHPSGITTLGGRLRASIELDDEVEEKGSKLSLRLNAGGETAYYAIYQELGTRHHPAHPFLRPALDEASRYYLRYVHYAIKQMEKTGI